MATLSAVAILVSCMVAILPLTSAQFVFNSGNFTTNSTYAKACNLTLSSLASNVTANGGFFNGTFPLNSDTLFTLGLCQGDLSNESCSACINSASQALINNCPNQKEGTDFGNTSQCIVRYSNKSFFEVLDTSPIRYVFRTVNITYNVNEFDWSLRSLADELRTRAAMGGSRLKFASGEKNFTDNDYVYGIMQCVPGLSSVDCENCLNQAVEDYWNYCPRKTMASIRSPSCIFQYDLSPFVQSSVGEAPPPPPPPPPLAPPPSTNMTMIEEKSNKFKTAIVVVVPMSTLLVLIALACAFFRSSKKEVVQRRFTSGCCLYNSSWIRAAAESLFAVSRHDVHHTGEDASQSLSVDSLIFDFSTIRAATDEFSQANELGHGGFGSVYKGKLSNGQEIAVKRLSCFSEQGEVQFKNEIILMARLQHKNLVRLLGFCLKGTERLLIYEFLPNASLDRFVFDPIKRLLLNWEARYKIIVGIAGGLLYLHQDSQLRIIHHDLKAGNILLDREMNPKIADFGMARLFLLDQSQGNTKRIAGTLGYMPPEYAKYGRFSIKTDVFSFGVLILEIVSGTRNGGYGGQEHAEPLISYAWKKWKQGKVSSLIDETLEGGSISEKMRCIHIGLLCVQENVAKRPTMASVVLMLKSFSSMSLPLPSKPAFLLDTSLEPGPNTALPDKFPPSLASSEQSPTHPINVSVNEASFTHLCPR